MVTGFAGSLVGKIFKRKERYVFRCKIRTVAERRLVDKKWDVFSFADWTGPDDIDYFLQMVLLSLVELLRGECEESVARVRIRNALGLLPWSDGTRAREGKK